MANSGFENIESWIADRPSSIRSFQSVTDSMARPTYTVQLCLYVYNHEAPKAVLCLHATSRTIELGVLGKGHWVCYGVLQYRVESLGTVCKTTNFYSVF